jgi:alpha-glucosidase
MKLLLLLVLVALVLCKSEYKVTNTVTNASSIVLTLTYTGENDYYLKPTSPIVKTLKFTFQIHTYKDFIVKITDANKNRFEAPQDGIIPKDPVGSFSYPISASPVSFEYTEAPFDFKITRKDNGAVLFSTYDKNLIYSDHYL